MAPCFHPLVQSSHMTEPQKGCDLPASHSVHSCEPVFSANVPTGQASHV
jgi:hypothetical protein